MSMEDAPTDLGSASLEGNLPSLYHASDLASLSGQRSTKLRTSWLLALVVTAAAGGAVDVSVADRLNVGGLVSTLAFAGALFLGLSTTAARPEVRWYEGRAAAESVKTMSYRYAVGGDPYGVTIADADAIFLGRLRHIMDNLPHLAKTTKQTEQITETMRVVRAADLPARRQFYVRDRIEDQINFYSRRQGEFEEAAHKLAILSALFAIVGIGFGVARMFDVLPFDLLGTLAAVVASLRAWSDMNQYRTTAAAYAVTTQELATTKSEEKLVKGETEWCRFVSDTEDAISREHTLWFARKSQVPR